jgi:FKBP-type peptidyl-prolyl cis-trans isomerase SlyD
MEKRSRCKIQYTITDDLGNVLDASGSSPLIFQFGENEVFPKLEQHLEKLSIGANFSLRLTTEEAYGPHQEHLIKSMPRSELTNIDIPLEQGAQFIAYNSSEEEIQYTVTEVTKDSLTLDANHPLAGLALNFEGKILA